MREKGRGSDPWQDEYFIDLGASSSAERNSGRQKAKGRPSVRNPSYSGRDGTAPGRRPARRPGDSAPARPSVRPPRPEYGESDRARRKPGGGESRRRPAPAPARKRRKQKKPMSKKGRAVVYLLTFFGVLTSAVMLCVFLLFRVAQIEVTGDQVYSASDILKICGYETGDNLVFLPTKEQEEQLERELPYIEKAEVRKRLPGTLEISVTAAKVGACIESGGSWLYLSENGKLLERQDKPMAGVMQIVGVTPEDSTLGTGLKLSDANVETVFRQIMAKLVELDAVNKFTKLDLSDLYNIRIWYEGRIQFLLGNAADLAYKVEFGYKIASDPKSIGTQETGTLDLTVANDVKRSTFTADKPGENNSASSAGGDSGTVPDSSSNDSSGEGDTSDDGRDGGIPDDYFTGGGDSSDGDTGGDTGDIGDTWDDGDTGDTWDTGDDGGTGDTGGTWDAGDGAGEGDGM